MIGVETVEELFYTACVKEQVSVTVFLVNGFQIKGLITAFDPNVVVVMTAGRQQMIHKHAISTIVPEKPLAAGVLNNEGNKHERKL